MLACVAADNNLIKHNLVVFRNGENALQVNMPLWLLRALLASLALPKHTNSNRLVSLTSHLTLALLCTALLG